MFESKCYNDFVVVIKMSTCIWGKLWCLSSILIWIPRTEQLNPLWNPFVNILIIWHVHIQPEILPSPEDKTKKLFTKKLYLYKVKFCLILYGFDLRKSAFIGNNNVTNWYAVKVQIIS